MTDLNEIYRERYRNVLVPTARLLEGHLRDHLGQVDRVDRIVARAKDPDRFLEKAQRQENGRPKYDKPLRQIQDQLGARVVVLFRDDVEIVAGEVRRYYRHIEEHALVPDSEWKFGYFGLHFILALPRDVVPGSVGPEDLPDFFEFQIKTLFQHAWSEANHDLGYKPTVDLLPDQERRLAFTAAQAWGADEIFLGLHRELAKAES